MYLILIHLLFCLSFSSNRFTFHLYYIVGLEVEYDREACKITHCSRFSADLSTSHVMDCVVKSCHTVCNIPSIWSMFKEAYEEIRIFYQIWFILSTNAHKIRKHDYRPIPQLVGYTLSSSFHKQNFQINRVLTHKTFAFECQGENEKPSKQITKCLQYFLILFGLCNFRLIPKLSYKFSFHQISVSFGHYILRWLKRSWKGCLHCIRCSLKTSRLGSTRYDFRPEKKLFSKKNK